MNWLDVSLVSLGFFLLFLIPIVLADNSYNICLNDTTKQTRKHMIISGSQNNTINILENITCSEGCSDTLNDCRWDNLKQVEFSAGIMGGFLVLSTIGLWISAKMESTIFMAILPIVSILSVFVAITDVFGTGYRTIFLAFTFVPVGLMFSGMFKEVEE